MELEYVSDDSPDDREDKAVSARSTIDRDRVLDDVMALVGFLLR